MKSPLAPIAEASPPAMTEPASPPYCAASETSSGARSSPTLEVKRRMLAWPRRFRVNPMPGMLYDGLETGFGWRIGAFNYWRALGGRYEILHVNFPNEVFRNRSRLVTLARTTLTIGVIGLAKLRRRRMAWTIHNIVDHESYHARLEGAFMNWFTRGVDLVVHMSEAGRDVALGRYPRLAEKQSAIIPHPHYGTTARPLVPREEALDALGLPRDCKLLLAFGVVRRYKNLLKLVRAFSDLPGQDVRLLIAGIPQDHALAEAIREAATDPRIILALREAEEDKIPLMFGAARIVVAPYLDILNSGTAFMALTYRRPILVPNCGAMKELQKLVGPEWVMLFDPPLTPLVLGSALHLAQAEHDAPPDLSRFTPERVVGDYDAAMRQLLTTDGVPAPAPR